MKAIEDDSAGKLEENDQAIRDYINQKQWNTITTRTTSGLYFVQTTAPATVSATSGPKPGEEVEFSYTLYLLNDKKIDEATDAKPVLLPYGLGAVIPGLEEGLGLMREGEKATLLLPYTLAYGQGKLDSLEKSELVPAYTPVRFDVHLIKSRTEGEQVQRYIQAKKLEVDERITNKVTGFETLKDTVWISRSVTKTGPVIGPNKKVTVNYKGLLLRGDRQFDANMNGTYSFTTNSNSNGAIPGFDAAIRQMRQGEKATIIFSSVLGYGTQGGIKEGVYVVPPYSPVRFDVEILKVE